MSSRTRRASTDSESIDLAVSIRDAVSGFFSSYWVKRALGSLTKKAVRNHSDSRRSSGVRLSSVISSVLNSDQLLDVCSGYVVYGSSLTKEQPTSVSLRFAWSPRADPLDSILTVLSPDEMRL